MPSATHRSGSRGGSSCSLWPAPCRPVPHDPVAARLPRAPGSPPRRRRCARRASPLDRNPRIRHSRRGPQLLRARDETPLTGTWYQASPTHPSSVARCLCHDVPLGQLPRQWKPWTTCSLTAAQIVAGGRDVRRGPVTFVIGSPHPPRRNELLDDRSNSLNLTPARNVCWSNANARATSSPAPPHGLDLVLCLTRHRVAQSIPTSRRRSGPLPVQPGVDVAGDPVGEPGRLRAL